MIYFQVHLLSERTISIRSKVSKMVVVIVVLFTICWGPIQIFVLFQSFYPNFKVNYATYKIKTWANCMSYANSSINPIVYGFMGASFRKSFRKTFPFLFKHAVRDSSVTSRAANAEIKFVATDESNAERKWAAGRAELAPSSAHSRMLNCWRILHRNQLMNLEINRFLQGAPVCIIKRMYNDTEKHICMQISWRILNLWQV